MELPTCRQQAILNGAPFYFTGKMCVHGHISKRDTRTSTCRECHAIMNITYAHTSKTPRATKVRDKGVSTIAARIASRKYYLSLSLEEHAEIKRQRRRRNPRRNMLVRAKGRAKQAGMEFSISLEDIIIPTYCPIFGVLLDTYVIKSRNEHSPSLDRIDSTKGYIPGNVQVISWKANRAKIDTSLKELIVLGKWAETQLIQESDEPRKLG